MPRIQVNYKSGASMVFDCEVFTLTRNRLNGELAAQWSGASPDPLKLGLSDTESIWDVSSPAAQELPF